MNRNLADTIEDGIAVAGIIAVLIALLGAAILEYAQNTGCTP
jgi:hypothetical protein